MFLYKTITLTKKTKNISEILIWNQSQDRQKDVSSSIPVTLSRSIASLTVGTSKEHMVSFLTDFGHLYLFHKELKTELDSSMRNIEDMVALTRCGKSARDRTCHVMWSDHTCTWLAASVTGSVRLVLRGLATLWIWPRKAFVPIRRERNSSRLL